MRVRILTVALLMAISGAVPVQAQGSAEEERFLRAVGQWMTVDRESELPRLTTGSRGPSGQFFLMGSGSLLTVPADRDSSARATIGWLVQYLRIPRECEVELLPLQEQTGKLGSTDVARWWLASAQLRLAGFEVGNWIVRVALAEDGRVLMMSGSVPEIPEELVKLASGPTIDETRARQAVRIHLAQNPLSEAEMAEPARLEMMGLRRIAWPDRKPALQWTGIVRSWSYGVDAVTGTVVGRGSLMRHSDAPPTTVVPFTDEERRRPGLAVPGSTP
jgi:hypothetical protein